MALGTSICYTCRYESKTLRKNVNAERKYASMKNPIDITSEHKSFQEEQKTNKDKEYYKAFADGDKKAFEMLVIEHKDHLIYFIQRIIQDITIAEDLAQDTFVEILVHKERYHYQVSFKTYLYTIAHNKAVDYIRKNKRLKFVEELPELISEELGLEQRVIKDDEERLLYRTMNNLKEEYRAAITLIDLEGLSYAEAAKVLGKSDAQMKILIYRARKSLAKLMEKEGFTYEK